MVICPWSSRALTSYAGLELFGQYLRTLQFNELVRDAGRHLIKAAKGVADNVHLPLMGIAGNSHMHMMDTNNQRLADLILAWLDRHARAR